MKKIMLAGVVGAIIAVGTVGVFAAEQHQAKVATAQANQSKATVFLYQEANQQSSHTQINFKRWHAAKPFYEKDGWIKVGFSDSGKTGWVNKKQLEHAWMANQERHSTIQTVFVSRQIDKDGKPVTNVVAYRNGHKISDQQAQKMYEHMRVSQLHQERAFSRMDRHLQQVMNRDFNAINQPVFDDPFFSGATRQVRYDDWDWPTS